MHVRTGRCRSARLCVCPLLIRFGPSRDGNLVGFRLGCRRRRDAGGLRSRYLGGPRRGSLARLGRRQLGDVRLGGDLVTLGRQLLVCSADRHGLAALDRLARSLAVGERRVRGDSTEAGTRDRCVRAALAVREDRGAAAGEVLACLPSAEGCLGLGRGKLGLRLDVDLPPGQARGEASVQALLADRERQLVLGDDDRRLLGLVVDVDLPYPRRRKGLREETGGLGVPRDDVDLLSAELRHDHADTRAARADAGPDRVDALGVGDDGDLRAVAGLTGDAADLHQAVRDLRHLELEERLDELGIAARQDHLRALRPGPDLGDDGLDARALLVALAVNLLRARQQRFDLAEVDEDVVAVAGLLDDAGDGLADPLLDDLLRGLRGDAAEVLGGDVLAAHLVLRDLVPVDLEVVVGDERVLLLPRLLLDLLELVVGMLSGLLEQALLEVGGHVDREDTEVAGVVDLDGRVPVRPGGRLVGGEQPVTESVDQNPAFEIPVALQLTDCLDDLAAHLMSSSIRFARTMASYGIACSVPSAERRTPWASASTTSPLNLRRPPISSAVRSAALRPTTRWKCAGVRSGRSTPGDETSTVYCWRYGRSRSVTRSQSA